MAMALMSTPTLHMLANAHICFIPYWVNGPQLASNVRTCIPNSQKLLSCSQKHNFSLDKQLMFPRRTNHSRRACSKPLTMDFRQAQSSTRTSPARRTASSVLKLVSSPNKNSPMSLTLLSTCMRWVIIRVNSILACAFLVESLTAL